MRVRYLKILIFILIASFFRQAIAGDSKPDLLEPPAKLSASLDKKSAHIGDIVTLTLNYRVPDNVKPGSGIKIEGLEDVTVIERQEKEGEIVLKIIVDSIDKFEVGPVSLSYIDREGIETIVRSEPVALEVLSNLGDKPAEAELKPIKDIVPITPLWLKYLPWIIGALFAAGIIAGIIIWRRRKNRELEEIKNLKPPHVAAEEEIKKLQSSNLFEKGRYKEFYFRLSEIIRQYIEKIRGFPAAEFTTEEISRLLESEPDRKMLPLLRESDLVKFADAVPTQARKDEDIRIAIEYIRDTGKPIPGLSDNKGLSGGAG